MIHKLFVAVPSTILPREQTPEMGQFERMTGITKTRRFKGTSGQVIEAALNLFKAEISHKIDGAVICVTQTPDRLSPCSAMDAHRILGVSSNVPAFDVNQSCSGFIYGLCIANQIPGHSLIVCIDRIRFNQSATESLIFSDAISICVASPSRYRCEFYNDGRLASSLYCNKDDTMFMDGGAIYDEVNKRVPKLIDNYQRKHGAHDYLCLHQANLSMMSLIEKRSGFTRQYSLHSIEEYGNQSMNSIPTALVTNQYQIHDGTVLLVGYGAGFSAAALGIFWGAETQAEIEVLDA